MYSMRMIAPAMGLGIVLCAATTVSAIADVVVEKTTAINPDTVTTEVVKTTSTTVPVRTTQIIGQNPVPGYFLRLSHLKDQIALGVSRGWITNEQANDFRQRLENVAVMAQDLRKYRFNQSLSDDIETRVNLLNIAVTDALKNNQEFGATQQAIPH